MIRPTPRSLPGIVRAENRKVSPSLSDSPMNPWLASWAEAARRSPWDPGPTIKRPPRRASAAPPGNSVRGKPVSSPVSCATSTIRRIARPSRQTDRPASVAASAIVLRRATLEANVVATTMPDAPRIRSRSGPRRLDSLRPGWVEKTLVESQVSARTPLRPISSQTAASKGSPTTGSVLILKSAEWTIRPAGVSMTRPALSGIEWLIGTKPTVNGPIRTVSGQAGATVSADSGTSPRSSSLSRAMAAVKRRAWIGARSRSQVRPRAPTWSSCAWVTRMPSMRSRRSWSHFRSGRIRSMPGVVSMSPKVTPRSTTISRSWPGRP